MYDCTPPFFTWCTTTSLVISIFTVVIVIFGRGLVSLYAWSCSGIITNRICCSKNYCTCVSTNVHMSPCNKPSEEMDWWYIQVDPLILNANSTSLWCVIIFWWLGEGLSGTYKQISCLNYMCIQWLLVSIWAMYYFSLTQAKSAT